VETVSKMTVEEAVRNLVVRYRKSPWMGSGRCIQTATAGYPADAVRGVIESKSETIRILQP